MKAIGNLLALIGLIAFIYTVVARFVGETSILGLPDLPVVGETLGKGFTSVGMLSGTACVLLLAVIALLKAKQ
ncbi:hypothetical protein ACFL5Y_01330 [Candidatus Omnitrophota bacterium]